MDNNQTDLRVEIEALKKDIDYTNNLNNRLDTAIEKLTDVSTSIKQMLAVHEEKINRQEQVDEVIFDKIRERGNEIDEVYKQLHTELEQTEKRLLIEIKSLKLDFGVRVGILEKYRWLIMGGAIVVGFILSRNFVHIVQMLT